MSSVQEFDDSPDADLHFIYKPTGSGTASPGVDFVSITDFLADEPACKILWQLIDTQFRTRSKFLAIWPAVKFVAIHRDAAGAANGFLLVSAPVNWQIDYVVVRPDSRGQGIASKLVRTALAHADKLQPPYVMLTSKESLRTLYEGCGFFAISPSPLGERG